MEHTDGPTSKESELSTRLSAEGKTAGGDSLAPPPYRAPWFAGAGWGAVLCAVYPVLTLAPLAAFAALSP
jgi:hypothetical protein